jgi:hypothetical protein
MTRDSFGTGVQVQSADESGRLLLGGGGGGQDRAGSSRIVLPMIAAVYRARTRSEVSNGVAPRASNRPRQPGGNHER